MRRLLLLTTLSLLFIPTQLPGDIVHLTDGSKREGVVIKETEAEVVLEMTMGGIKASLRIPRSKVVRIERKKTESELLREEFARKRKTLQADDLDATESLADWCAARQLYSEAAELYRKMSGTGQPGLKRGQLGLSKMEFERGALDTALAVAEQLNEKLPEDKDVLTWLTRLRKVRKEDLVTSFERALDHRKKNKPERALKSLQLLLGRLGPQETAHAFAGMAVPGNPDLFETMAALRLARKCSTCKEGKLTCKRCDGTGKIDRGQLCPTCKGSGYVACRRCAGTDIFWDSVSQEERPAVVALLGRMRDQEREILSELNRKLADPNVSIGEVPNIINEATCHAGRIRAVSSWALPLTNEVALIGEFTKGRLESHKLISRMYLKAAGSLETAATSQIKRVEESRESLLKHDDELCGAYNFYELAMSYYASVDGKVVTVAERPRETIKRLKKTMRDLDRILERNVTIKRVYEVAVKATQAGQLNQALRALVELVTRAPRLDVEYLAEQHKRNSPETLSEFMAKCRFESGKDNRKGFGNPTDYEKADFVKRLLSEAGAKAREARERYESLRDARARGRTTNIPPSRIKSTKDIAKDARDWYQTVLTIKYPLRQDTVEQIEDTIEEMKHIISKCKRWYSPGPTTPTVP